jgi:NhaP-type Na+/H+ or K+/H+ antiporter
MLFTAALPGLSEPGTIGFGAAIGAFVGGTVAWLLRYDEDNRIRWMATGSYWGTGFAFLSYLIANALGVGSR